MIYHPQMKEWARKEQILSHVGSPSLPARPAEDAPTVMWEVYHRKMRRFKADESEWWAARERHNAKRRNIVRHLQTRQLVTRFV